MSPILKAYLDKQGVKYVRIEHSPAFTMREVAASTHYPGRQMAKTVIVDLDGQLAMAVLPANQRVNLHDLRDVTGCESAKFASELEFQGKFPDCEVGAIPPFGNLYNMDVYLAEALTLSEQIAFNAGSHTEVIKMPYADYERLVRPKVTIFTT